MSVEKYIDSLPSPYREIALKAIEEETKRWEEGRLTDAEYELIQCVQAAAARLALEIDEEAVKLLGLERKS